MAAEDAQRQDLLEVSSRLGKQLTDMVDDVADATREMRETALRVAQGLSGSAEGHASFRSPTGRNTCATA